MATSFIKSFMEAVNPAAARATKRTQNPQDPMTKGTKQPEAASNALLDVTSKEALEERPVGPEIIVIPQAQMAQMDDMNVLKIPADEAAHEDLPEQVIVCWRIPVESEEESSVDTDPVLTTIDETGPGVEDITGDAKLFQEAATEYQLAYQSLDKKYSSRLS